MQSHSHSHEEPQFKYGNLLLTSLLPPLLVLGAFGGRPTKVAACFGAIIAYIFDVLGTMEVSLDCREIEGLCLIYWFINC